ncbi:hypothetical protein ACFL6F_02450 [Planctomycetota bacterium]
MEDNKENKYISILKYWCLLDGAISIRISLASFYLLLLAYIISYGFFLFEIEPASASRMNDMSFRAGLGFFPILMIAFGSLIGAALGWALSLVFYFAKDIRSGKLKKQELVLLILPLISYLVLSKVLDLFYMGHGTAIHAFFYNLVR